MLCKTENDKYTILSDNERFPFQLDKKYVDQKLSDLSLMFSAIRNELHELYETDKNLYDLIVYEVLEPWGIKVSDGFSKLDCVADELSDFKRMLAALDDDIPAKEDIILLPDLGFEKEFLFGDAHWIKKIKDERDIEIVEEVFIREEDFLHRIRTIEYRETDFGRESTKIEYKEAKEQTTELLAAIRNTRREVFGC